MLYVRRHTFQFLCIYLIVVLAFLSCRQPAETNLIRPAERLPDEKVPLLKYHFAASLTTEIKSAPLLAQTNHPNGWKKANCTRCHETPTPVDAEVCSNCHGKNGVRNQVDTCQSCHNASSEFGEPPTGAHSSHVRGRPAEEPCLQCHPDPSQSNAHADGVVNVVFAQGGQFTEMVTALGGGAGCTGVACHEDRLWVSEGCRSCHGSPPDTGLHKVHLDKPYLTCRDCHAGNQHDDDANAGEVDVGGIEYNAMTGDCTSTCHVDKTLNWGCKSCHGYPPESGNHGGAVHNFSCDQCHGNHQHSYIAAVRPLDFQEITVSLAKEGTYQDGTDDGIPNGLCSDVACHDNRTWGSTCADCHGNPPDTGTHVLHIAQAQLECQDCHGGNQHDLDKTSGVIEIGGESLTKYDRFSGDCLSSCHQREQWACDTCHGFPPESVTHLSHDRPEGNILKRGRVSCNQCHLNHQHSYKAATAPKDFSAVRVSFVYGGEFDPETRTCSKIGCHESLVWGSLCQDCHGDPPNTGAHLAHTGKEQITCYTCHGGRQHDQGKRGSTIDVAGAFTYNAFTGECTTSCHSRVEQWGCNGCHGIPPMTGQHQRHVIDLKLSCRLCHSDHKHSFKAVTTREPSDATVTFTLRGVWQPTTRTCTNVGCHGDVKW